MPSITKTVSSKSNQAGEGEIYLRVFVRRDLVVRVKSGVFVPREHIAKDGGVALLSNRHGKSRKNDELAARLQEAKSRLDAIENFIYGLIVSTPRERMGKEFLQGEVERFKDPSAVHGGDGGIYRYIDEYIESTGKNRTTKRDLFSLRRHLAMYEDWKRETSASGFELSALAFTADFLKDFKQFLAAEHELLAPYPHIWQKPTGLKRAAYKLKRKGENTISAIFARLKAYANWCVKRGYLSVSPFARYDEMPGLMFGTPWYLSEEERNALAQWHTDDEELATMRDVFVFQCYVGCRVSDLVRFTPESVVDGVLQYIPKKTRHSRSDVVTVPLHKVAAAIVEKYAPRAAESGRLLPCAGMESYNASIKRMLRECGITRMVTVLDPLTRTEVQRRICDIASSHLARRTFIGNLYNKVRDPEIIGSMSGHAPGSKAFARYRTINEDIKRSVIDKL